MDRRQFITWMTAGGLALGLRPILADAPLSPWITIGTDGRITLTCTALEMGQGSRTGQAQTVGENL